MIYYIKTFAWESHPWKDCVTEKNKNLSHCCYYLYKHFDLDQKSKKERMVG